MALKAVAAPLGSPVGGTGTDGTIPRWTGASTLGDSPLTVSGNNVTGAGAIRATGTTPTTPAFMRHDATTSGIYFPAQNEIGFTISGAHAMFISTGRNICMGTTTPASANTRLTVAGGFIVPAAGFGVYQAGDHLTLQAGAGKNVHLRPNDGGVLAVNVGTTSCDMSAVSNYGLKLPATPGNGNANTLDSYQEGTRVLSAGDLSGWTYVTATQYWTLVGRTVTLHTVFTGGTSSATGGATIATPPLLTPLRIAAGAAVNSSGTALGNGACVVAATSSTTGTVITSSAISSSAVDKVLTVTYETAGL